MGAQRLDVGSIQGLIMTYPTFTPPVAPSPGTADKPAFKILKADFGDGYSQAVPDGLNTIRRMMSVEWELLTPTDAATIINFLKARVGVEPFWWTPTDEITALKWTCSDFSDRRGDGGFRSISAKFEQSFLL